MMRNVTVAALAACLLLPAMSGAQDTPRRPGRPRVRVETRNGPFGVYTFSDNRGRIGVIVDPRADAAGDKVGARIEGVTPGGPAEKAGLKVGLRASIRPPSRACDPRTMRTPARA